MCQLSLLDYYASYGHVTAYFREESADLVNFYISGKNITSIFVKTDNGMDLFKYTEVPSGIKMFHGQYDIYRNDKYRLSCSGHNPKGYDFFIEAFYGCYDIPYSERVNSFSISRNIEAEDDNYCKVMDERGEYIVIHEDRENHVRGVLHKSTNIDIQSDLPIINLNCISNTMFDYIKVIQKAKEIHLVDSVWAAMCYQLDAKYGIFLDNHINIYAKRGHKRMFELPVRLKNWNII